MSSQLHAPAAISLGENHDTHWREVWVVPSRPSLDVLNKRKIFEPRIIQPVAYLLHSNIILALMPV